MAAAYRPGDRRVDGWRIVSRRLTLLVVIDRVETPAISVRTSHDVDQPIGTGSVTVLAPVPRQVRVAAPVDIYAGWDGATARIFSGRIADTTATWDDRGGMVTIPLEGHAWRLRPSFYESNRGYNGPLRLSAFVLSQCASRGVPTPMIDISTTPDDDDIELGSNPDVNGGWIPLPTTTSPLDLIRRYSELFGYRLFDRPDGVTRWKRISGAPTGSVQNVPLFSEGVSGLSFERSETMRQMVNYWDVWGARYTASDTSDVAIRSFPASVPFDERLGVNGVNQQQIRDEALVTQLLADAARNAHEIDYADPLVRWRWQTTGRPDLQTGDSVAVQSPTVNAPSDGSLIGNIVHLLPVLMWLMRVEHTISDAGWTTALEGWTGWGDPLPAGNDCTTQTLLGSQGVHVGNEWLAHYRNPSPAGTQYDMVFTLPDDYSTANVRGLLHGANSFQFNEESEASRFEVWHSSDTDRPSASGVLPRVAENLEQRYPYGPTDQYWEPFVVPLSGRLKAGSNRLRVIAGEDRNVGDVDDFELANITLTLCGVGQPDLVVSQ